jgi:hypothetical protein
MIRTGGKLQAPEVRSTGAVPQPQQIARSSRQRTRIVPRGVKSAGSHGTLKLNPAC